MSAALLVQLRETSSKGELRRLRESGGVPGVVYGKGLAAASKIAIDARALAGMLKGNPYAVIDMDIPGAGKHPVMLSEMQKDPISGQVLHIDFRRIDLNEKITTSARLDFTGESPGEKEGGLLQVVLHEIEIECYPKDIPDAIAADVSGLEMGEHLTIGEIALPSGVAAVQDPETVVVAVLAPQKERSEEEAEALDDQAEEDRKHAEAAKAAETD
ncbi:50S ribosomal protein L25 [Cohnella hongkongensis]|uniref:Large ribosomal subunit protein bL25 n=1 Tax=Cohnella hongkongensis TaxID=178337 RepID=A0ABV9FF49_9BACL